MKPNKQPNIEYEIRERLEYALIGEILITGTELDVAVTSIKELFDSHEAKIRKEIVEELEKMKCDDHVSGVIAMNAHNSALNQIISFINKK